MSSEGEDGSAISRLLRQLADITADHAPFAQGLADGATITIGEELPGRYQLLGELGRGGQSVVHLAFDAGLGRHVAFKQRLGAGVHGAGGSLVQAEVRFVREARITAQLDHPGIAPIHEIGRRADGSLYATQKLVHGRTLAAELHRRRSTAERLALLPAILGACQAVAYAHARGVIHRDLKPANIMLGALGEVVVLDWGLARTRDGQGAGAPDERGQPGPAAAPPGAVGAATLADGSLSMPVNSMLNSDQTRVGHVFGTPGYMSPEQAAASAGEVDERSDVWSLGVILYELLAGQRPFADQRRVLGEAHQSVGWARVTLAGALSAAGRGDEAVALFREGIARLDPGDLGYLREAISQRPFSAEPRFQEALRSRAAAPAPASPP